MLDACDSSETFVPEPLLNARLDEEGPAVEDTAERAMEGLVLFFATNFFFGESARASTSMASIGSSILVLMEDTVWEYVT